MIKVGLIGCGFMGSMHANCYEALGTDYARIVAVADPRKDFAEKVMKEDTAYYRTGMELIANADVDMVDICLPTDLHVPHAVAAMKAGKNVFVEKPVCFREQDMQLLLQTEKETGKKLQVAHVIRHWAEYVWLKKAVDSGEYGKVLCGDFVRVSSRPEWASDNWLHTVSRSGGVAVDMHIHDVDYVRYLMGEPDRVQAQAYRDEEGVIQHISALYGYGSNVAINVQAGWNYPATFPFTATFRVKLEKATIVSNGGLTVYPNEGEPFQPKLEEEFQSEAESTGNISSLGGYYNEIKYFVEGLEGKNDLSIATAEEAIKSVKLVLREIEIAGGLIAK